MQFDQDGKPIHGYNSIREAAKATGVKRSTIFDSCNGRVKSCKGYYWRYMKRISYEPSTEEPAATQPRPLVHASLFSGIGGPEVAAAMLGWRNAFHCEINPFGRAVLDYWFPESVSYEDITKTDFHEWRGRIDVLTGGFPCQPFFLCRQTRRKR